MVRIPSTLRSLLLLAYISTSPALALPAGGTFIGKELTATKELSTCAADDLEACSSDLPSNFCCPAKTSCVSLAGGTTVLCCPDGQDCRKIRPITCALTQQDADENPSAPIKTTELDGELPKCGEETCCPFGYTCDGNGLCVKDRDQSQKPDKPTTTSSPATGEPTSTNIPDTTAVPTVLPTTEPVDPSSTESATTSSPTNSDDDDGADGAQDGKEAQDSGPDTAALIGGVIGGLACLIFIAVGVWLCYRRQKKKTFLANQEKAGRPLPSSSSKAPSSSHRRNASSIGQISEPIVQQNSYRTDFIRKPSSENRRSSRPTTRFPVNPNGYWDTIDNSDTAQQQSQTQQPPPPRISIFNPFDSPNPSPSSTSHMSDDAEDSDLRHGTVPSGARLAPIRAMKASSRHLRPAGTGPRREPSSESINVFADPRSAGGLAVNEDRLTRETTFTQMMDEARLGDVHRGRPYVPGTTPRI